MFGRDRGYLDEMEETTPSDAPIRPHNPFTRPRIALLVAGLFFLWLVGVFARQVGEAQAAATEADQMRARNVAMEKDIRSLEQELRLVKQPAFVSQMARGYMLGTSREIPFTVDPAAPALPSDAPGSSGIKPEKPAQETSPLDAWLQVLFGAQR